MSDDTPHDPRSLVRRGTMPQSLSRPVATPIWPSVVYRSTDADELDSQYEGRAFGYTYAREGHPNADMLREKLDWLEGVTPAMGKGVVVGSGMAAVSCVLLGLLSAGDHIVAGDQLYGRTLRLLRQELPRLGLPVTFADPTDARAVRDAIRPETKMIMVEVVSNPTLRVADMDGIAQVAADAGALLVVDNTFTTPKSYKPLQSGAHISIQSVTKLLAGHSDVTLGWVAADTPARNKALYDAAVTWGMTPSPFDCWLAERGLYTFELRHAAAQANAAALADHLAGLPNVAQVLYPGRPDHPDHNRAVALLGGHPGNMLSFRLKGGRDEVNRFLRAAGNIAFAPTLGDVGTTISHPPSSSHRGLTPEGRAAIGIDEGFIRLSVGVEDLGQLRGELTSAIAAAV